MRYHRHTQRHRPPKKQLIFGIDNVIAALEDGTEIERIFLRRGLAHQDLKRLTDQKLIPVSYVPEAKLKSFNVDAHEGVIALKSKIQYQDLQDVITWIVGRGEVPSFLLLDGITDIRNIGAIARTCYAMGIDALVIPTRGVGMLNEDAVATSAGALEQLQVCRVEDLKSAIELLQLNGIRVFASEMTAKGTLFDLDMKVPVAIIMGSEDHGVDPQLYKMCDSVFRIPMKNNFESLNVSVAAGMILYELMKQRMA